VPWVPASLSCYFSLVSLPPFSVKEHFQHKDTYALLKKLDDAAYRAHRSRGQVFEDFLEMSVCALAGGTMEEPYLQVVQRYAKGEKGKRPVDLLAELFGELVNVMEQTGADVLGDLFQGAITYGEHGQFYTPENLCAMMARMQMHKEGTGKRILDPCCGSGRMLLACAEVNRSNEFYGQDIDLRCVRMTAINLALRNLNGYVLWGNSLMGEQKLAYRTAFNGSGFVRELKIDEVPEIPRPDQVAAPARPDAASAGMQLELFEAAPAYRRDAAPRPCRVEDEFPRNPGCGRSSGMVS
jgi:hypothetical protein